MTFALKRKAIRLFNHPDTPKPTRRHMQRQWLRSMEMLGDKHVFTKKIVRPHYRDNLILSR